MTADFSAKNRGADAGLSVNDEAWQTRLKIDELPIVTNQRP